MASAATKYAELSAKVAKAIQVGKAAADAAPNDGGSANLDRVCLTGMKGVREGVLRNAGIDGYKHKSTFHLTSPFGGQGLRRYEGVQAMYRSLSEAGVPCYVHYQLD